MSSMGIMVDLTDRSTIRNLSIRLYRDDVCGRTGSYISFKEVLETFERDEKTKKKYIKRAKELISNQKETNK